MITAKELLGEAKWCEERSSPGFEAVASTLRRAAERITELESVRTHFEPGNHHLALEAWEWLSGTHPMIQRGGTYSPAARALKAETCLSAAVEWEEKHPDGARRWLDDDIAGNP